VRPVRSRVASLVIACVVAAIRALPAQQAIPADKARIADAVRADLAKLADLERSYFATNKRYTDDIRELHFVPASRAAIAVSYASARTFSASASDAGLAPFLCFVIVSAADAGSPAEKPFCTDSRYGTAASALVRAAAEAESARAPGVSASPPASVPAAPVAVPAAGRAGAKRAAPFAAARAGAKRAAPAAKPAALTAVQFAERLRTAVGTRGDSIIVMVQFAVKDARYDPSRGVLEVAVESVPLPLMGPAAPGSPQRPALACFTRPAFVCGESGLTYIARDLLRVPRSKAPDPDLLRSGLFLQARFAIGRRDDTPGPALTLLALILQAQGEVVSQWVPAVIR
jgi:hypothetical protein